jgi:hypothetical protein
MTNKQKRQAAWMYQFVTYSPSAKKIVETIDKATGSRCAELVGCEYPYRRGMFDIDWVDAFQEYQRPKKRYYK